MEEQARLDRQTGVWESNMLWTIVAVLLILWLLGFSMHLGGGIIHILLVIALIVIVFNLLSGRRTA
jgi:hypothetical protein